MMLSARMKLMDPGKQENAGAPFGYKAERMAFLRMRETVSCSVRGRHAAANRKSRSDKKWRDAPSRMAVFSFFSAGKQSQNVMSP